MINRIAAVSAYGDVNQAVRVKARRTADYETQLRFAENSNDRLTLANLALNENITDEIVQLLFDRDIPQVTKALEKQGYSKKNTLQRIID